MVNTASKTLVELRVPVSDQEPHPPTRVLKVHHQVPGLLGNPVPGRVRGDAEDTQPARGVFDDEERVQPAQRHRLQAEEVARHDAFGLGVRNCTQLGPERLGAGSSPQQFRIDHTVEAPTRYPSPASSPWILRYPQVGLSTARRLTNARSPGGSGGRPGARFALVVHPRVTKRRCQRRIVAGVTSIPTRRGRGSHTASAAITARSVHNNRGRPTWRCRTAS